MWTLFFDFSTSVPTVIDMRLTSSIFISILILISTGKADGEVPISAKAEVDKGFVTIGEPFEYKIIISHDPSVQVTESIEGFHLGDFRIKGVSEIGPLEEDGRKIFGKSFTLTTYSLGNYLISSIPIRYLDSNNVPGQVMCNPIYITVKSVDPLRAPESDIRGIKSVKDLALESYTKVLRGGGGLSILGITAWLLAAWYLKWRKRGSQVILSPSEWALKELRALFDSNLLNEEKYKEYFSAVSSTLRVYLLKEFNISAPELTTREIKQIMKQKSWDQDVRELLTRVLEECDIVKFAGFVPHSAHLSTFHNRAEESVLKLRPHPDVEEMQEVQSA